MCPVLALSELTSRARNAWRAFFLPFKGLPLSAITAQPEPFGGEWNPEFQVLKGYRDYNPARRSVKYRTLHCPNEQMRVVHRRLMYFLREAFAPIYLPMRGGAWISRCVCGGIPGKSTMDNILPHRKNRYFFLTDLRSAYPSVSLEMLLTAMSEIAPQSRELFSTHLAEFLRRYCLTEEGHLPTGSPSSPDLFNIYCSWAIDATLQAYCYPRKICYTRYLDDLTFSCSRPISRTERATMRRIIEEASLTVAHHKSQVLDLSKRAILITGFRLVWQGARYPARVIMPRHLLNHFRGLLQVALRGGHVKPSRIFGYWGMFRASITEWSSMNSTEREVKRMFFKWRRRYRDLKYLGPKRLREAEEDRRKLGLKRQSYWRKGRHRRWLRQKEAKRRLELVCAGLVEPTNRREQIAVANPNLFWLCQFRDPYFLHQVRQRRKRFQARKRGE